MLGAPKLAVLTRKEKPLTCKLLIANLSIVINILKICHGTKNDIGALGKDLSTLT